MVTVWVFVSGHANPQIVICACFHAPSPLEMCASVASFKAAFIQGRGPTNKRVCICIRCMVSAEREQSKKDIRGGQRERGQILHCGVGGRKGSSELGSGWKLTEKEFGLVPCGDKSLKIPPSIQPENGREEQHAERGGLFYSAWKGSLFFSNIACNL